MTTDDFRFISHSETETDHLGRVFAGTLQPGMVVALDGQLGSGKTRFTRAVCAGLGIDTRHVNSPTFVIQQLYTDGRIPVTHFDAYRLADADEFLALGAEEYLVSDQWVCLVEWAERIQELLPRDSISIRIQQTGEQSREFEFHAAGARGKRILSDLQRSFASPQ